MVEHFLEERSVETKEQGEARESVHKTLIHAGRRIETLTKDPLAEANIPPHLLNRA